MVTPGAATPPHPPSDATAGGSVHRPQMASGRAPRPPNTAPPFTADFWLRS